MELAVCLSFAKMMGLYSERVGALNLVTNSAKEARVVESHLEQLMRAEISNPPAFGARVAAEVLSDPELRASWKSDMKSMTFRLQDMRLRLVEELKRLGEYRILNATRAKLIQLEGCPKNFDHVVEEGGLFTILGLTREQVHLLRGTTTSTHIVRW